MESERITSSFRDPSGYVYEDGNHIRRVIKPIYFRQYQALSGEFYQKLFSKKYLIPHAEISKSDINIIIQPEKIPFVSYPYEWSFPQYKHAAQLTLKMQMFCLENGFSLKDASAFNVTFHNGKPIFIDTLSFDFYHQDEPWKAYKQFIMHFLGPLVLSSYFGLDFLKSLATDIDGIPLKRLSKLLPFKSRFSPTLWTNIHLPAKYEGKYAASGTAKAAKLSKSSQMKLLQSLYDFISELKAVENTEWDDYYNQTNYNDEAYQAKKSFIKEWVDTLQGKRVIDIGGNDGTFAREFASEAQFIIVADVDANAVGQNYRRVIENKEKNILPVVADILNPAAGYGFNNRERFSFIERVQAMQLSGCMALAVIHHITLSGNIPFDMSAKFFSKMAPSLLIEFPTRNDSWVQYLLESKRDFKDHFGFYNEVNFQREYSKFYQIEKKFAIPDSERILYSLKLRA
jgi:hypothetical protein